jgi:hypothetical protein
MMPTKGECVLLVEGRDDEEVVYHFCTYHGIDNRSLFTVKPKGGYERLRVDLINSPPTGLKVIGAIVDADTDPHGRWQSLRNGLLQYGYSEFPTEPSAGGTIIPGIHGLPVIGIWLMPNNSMAGILEDFLLSLSNDGDVLLDRARSCVDSIPDDERKFVDTYHSKALIHTWLAWQEEPGKPLGAAIRDHYLDADKELAIQFLGWLQRLFPAP